MLRCSEAILVLDKNNHSKTRRPEALTPGLLAIHRLITSTALTVATGQAGRTPVHHDHCLGAAFAAHGGIGRVVAGFFVVRGRGVAGFELGALFGEDALGGFAHFLAFQKADGLQVLLDHGADFSHQGGHEHATFLEVAAVGVVHATQLFHQEGDVATLAEYRRDYSGEGDDPLEVFHRLGVDEHLVRLPAFVVGAFVEQDVVDGNVHRMLSDRRLDLIGGAQEKIRPLDVFVHLNGLGFRFHRCLVFGYFRVGFLDSVADDFVADFNGHVLCPVSVPESILSVGAFFKRVKQVGGVVDFAVVLYLFVALEGDLAAVVQGELVQRVFQVLLFDQNALESFRVEAEGGATLQAHVVGVKVDALEILIVEVCRNVGRFGNRGIHPLLGSSLDVDVLRRRYVIGGGEVGR